MWSPSDATDRPHCRHSIWLFIDTASKTGVRATCVSLAWVEIQAFHSTILPWVGRRQVIAFSELFS